MNTCIFSFPLISYKEVVENIRNSEVSTLQNAAISKDHLYVKISSVSVFFFSVNIRNAVILHYYFENNTLISEWYRA